METEAANRNATPASLKTELKLSYLDQVFSGRSLFS